MESQTLINYAKDKLYTSSYCLSIINRYNKLLTLGITYMGTFLYNIIKTQFVNIFII